MIMAPIALVAALINFNGVCATGHPGPSPCVIYVSTVSKQQETLIPLYSDRGGQARITNPFQSDRNGNYTFYYDGQGVRCIKVEMRDNPQAKGVSHLYGECGK